MPKTKAGPPTTGSVFRDSKGRWTARVTWTDADGKRHDRKRRATSKSDAQDLRWKLLNELEQSLNANQAFDPAKMTVAQLVTYYTEHKLQPAQFVDGRKVAGLKDPVSPAHNLQLFADAFGHRPIKTITRADLERYRAKRFKVPTRRGNDRTPATVNRELGIVRTLFRFAVGEGWLQKSPTDGAKLVERAGEKKRERILSPDEETRLLAVCTGRRAHLGPIVCLALDTGMRRGEILSLEWADVDFSAGLIHIRATNTKTEESRTVGLTSRVRTSLRELWIAAGRQPGRVFDLDDCKHSFTTACRMAGITGMRFHDLRHTAITRMVAAGLPPAEVMKISGHHQWTTFMRYVNPDQHSASRAAEALEKFNRK
ncbi:MAG: tyrosine-type recombinase/integrase [Blastocatellia bacterium]|nr:tyrosine-type recombinase/integrase [Blastocatellia bacterium]